MRAPKQVEAPKPTPKQVERQGYLPNFLGQIDNVRIEEMVAEKIFQRLSTRIDAAVENIFKKVGSDE